MLRIMTLNMWGYYDWDVRKDNILSLVKSESPDVIALQEVQLNHAFSYSPESDFIANNCGYKYRIFAPTYPRSNQIDRSGSRTQRTSYGLAFLSKYPIETAETHFLELYPDHQEECSVLFCTVNVGGSLIKVCNVHFANSDKHSDLHLRELICLCEQRNEQPVIVGDFNIFDLSAYKNSVLKGYSITTDNAHYVSMPKDHGTLDYIAAPDSRYNLKEVLCSDVYVSDHRALLATIESRRIT